MIGIIGALDIEIALLREKMEEVTSLTLARLEYLTGTLMGHKVVLLRSGIGKVNATIGTQIMIDRFKATRIIFTGLAGSLIALNRGDLVMANYVVQYDFDLTAFGRRHGEVPDVGRMIETDPELLRLACEAYDSLVTGEQKKPKMIVGTVVSGDKFISDPGTIAWLQREFGAVATEMEGAAVGYTCYVNEIPFIVIRLISDSGGDNAKDEFEDSAREASLISFQIVTQMLGQIKYVEV